MSVKPVPYIESRMPAPKADQFFVETDDGLTVLTADEFVEMRGMLFVAEFQASLPSTTRKNYVITCVFITVNVFSSVLSTFNLGVLIPAALAFGSSVLACLERIRPNWFPCGANQCLHYYNSARCVCV